MAELDRSLISKRVRAGMKLAKSTKIGRPRTEVNAAEGCANCVRRKRRGTRWPSPPAAEECVSEGSYRGIVRFPMAKNKQKVTTNTLCPVPGCPLLDANRG